VGAPPGLSPRSPGYRATGLAGWRLRCELRAAHAGASARVLPEFLSRMQMAERARNGAKIVIRETLGNLGVVERLARDSVQDLLRHRGHFQVVAGAPRRIGLAVYVILDFFAIRIRIGGALVIFMRDALPRGVIG